MLGVASDAGLKAVSLGSANRNMQTSTQSDLICFSHLRWDFVFQRPQHLMKRFAAGRRVFYVEEPIFEAVEADLIRVRGCPLTSVTVVTPILPSSDSEMVLERQRKLIAEYFFQQDITSAILWFYTPMALPLSLTVPNPTLIVYDCMDELSLFRNAPSELPRREQELMNRADVVFTGGRALYESKSGLHPNMFCCPSGVDVDHFGKARQEQSDPVDQANIPHPRFGFAGVIDERMDLPLLADVAKRRPHWHFVMIGPTAKIEPGSLPSSPNIHWLGKRDYQALPSYFSHWDVAFMPFALNDSTRFISPTKTPEFLAAGLPVISTPLTDVVRPYGEMGMALIASDADQFIVHGETCLAASHSMLHDNKVDTFLATQSWDAIWRQMADLVDRVPYTSPKSAALQCGRFELHNSQFDFLIVGAGFAGSVVASEMARKCGKRVLVVDKRPHIGGNAYDSIDSAGIRIHPYGPHIFHTNSKSVFDYLSQFTSWRQYEHRVLAQVDGKLVPVPINLDTVNRLYGLNLGEDQVAAYFESVAEKREPVRTSEDVVVSKVGRDLYEKLFRGYTRKQWALDPSELDSSVIARIPVRTNRDDRYFTDTYQAMPLHGYTRMFENMLDHPNIEIVLGTSYRDVMSQVRFAN